MPWIWNSIEEAKEDAIGDHPDVVFITAKDDAVEKAYGGLGIFKKTNVIQYRKPVWKHVNRDVFLFYTG